MKSIYKYVMMGCAVIAGLASCDKTADEVKIEKIEGMYSGNIYASLYAHDHEIETELTGGKINAADSLTWTLAHLTNYTQMDIDFNGEVSVDLAIESMKNMKFTIPFIEYDEAGDSVKFKSKAYENGLFGNIVKLLQYCYRNPSMTTQPITKAQFKYFIQMADTLSDEITLTKIHTCDVPIVEEGMTYMTYDDEQCSHYCAYTLDTLNYHRSTNVTAILDGFAQNLIPVIQNETYKASLTSLGQRIKSALKTDGIITDGSGYMLFAYSNYRPTVHIEVHKATGLLDDLSIALFGYVQDANKMPVMLDGKYQPTKDLWLILNYRGDITNADGGSWVKLPEE